MNFFVRGLSASWRHPVFNIRRDWWSSISGSWTTMRRQSNEAGSRSWRSGRHHSGEVMLIEVIGQAIMNAAAIDKVNFQNE